jgi:hypothetical protein
MSPREVRAAFALIRRLSRNMHTGNGVRSPNGGPGETP